MPDTTLGTGVQYLANQPYWDAVLTNFFLTNFPDAKNNGSVLLPMVERQPKETVSGRYIVFPISYGRNTGVQNVGLPRNVSNTLVNTTFPVAGRQNYANATTRTRVGMARIQIDGATMAHGKTNGGAWAEAVGLEMSKVMDDIKMDRARQVHNDGSGRLAEVQAIPSGGATTITLRVNSSIEGATNTRAAGTLDQSGWLDVGQRIAFLSSDGTTVTTKIASDQRAFFITAIAVSGSFVTITVATQPTGSGGTTITGALIAAGGQPIAVGDWVVRAVDTGIGQTDFNNTSWRNELTGFGGIFSDTGVLDGGGTTGSQQVGADDFAGLTSTVFQGISTTSNLWNQGIVLDNGGSGNRPISYELLQQALSDAEKRNNANVGFLLSSYETYNSYIALVTPDKRYDNTTNLQTGHTTLSFNGLPWYKDRFCYQNRVYFVDLSPLRLLETLPMQGLRMDGMTEWERVLSSSQPTEMYWRGWKWEDQLAVCEGVRERMGAVLTELTS
jgi:hypothetical protein